jgi:UDP-4-amino-4,6-dideoxy-N-acetyl-beta-L-altrosamine N-acetyltransferase
VQLKALEIRNESSVRQAMFLEDEVSLENFLIWVERLKKDPHHEEYLVFDENNHSLPLGVVCLNEINFFNKTANWAIYLTEKEQSRLGGILEWFLINHAFDILGLEKLNCQVLESNTAVIKLHHRYYFQDEGFLREQVRRKEQKVGVVCLGLTKYDWMTRKNQFKIDHEALINRFDVKIENVPTVSNQLLRQIEEARESYNISLSILLRLSLESRPQNKITLDEFMRVQQKVLDLEKELLALVSPIIER